MSEMIQYLLFGCEVCATVDGFDAETWRPVTIERFSHYEVSSFGRFRCGARYLKGSKNHNGYIHIGFSRRGGKQEFFLAHRVVAEAFIVKPETDRYLLVNHIDRNRHNNRVENLEWVTASYNAQHWRDANRYGRGQ